MKQHSRKPKRVGVLFRALDPLFMEHQCSGVTFLYLVLKGGRDEALAKRILPRASVVTLTLKRNSPSRASLSTGDLLTWTNLRQVCRARNLDAFMLSHRGTKALNDWARRSGLTLITTPLRDQLRYEDKIFFDRWLREIGIPKPRSAVVRANSTRTLPFKGITVLQKPLSFGGVGTFFVTRPEELQSLMDGQAVLKGERLLAREFVRGRTFGITVWIGPDIVACSAIREQCFFPKKKQRSPAARIFAGIQWISSSDVPQKATNSISQVFTKLGSALHKKQFFGFANFDFILTPRHEVLVLECNPRLSSATPQLLAEPSLIHGLPVGKFFVEGALSKKPYAKTPAVLGLPTTSYCGALLDIPADFSSSADSLVVSREFPLGLYQHVNGRQKSITLVTPDISEIPLGLGLYFSEAKKGDKVTFDETTGSIISSLPLFSRGGRLRLSTYWLLSQFEAA